MSAPMVRAILDGSKSQTRRIVKPQPVVGNGAWGGKYLKPPDGHGKDIDCPYGKPGDRLWVKETHAIYQTINHTRKRSGASFSEVSDGLCAYRADGHDLIADLKSHIRLMSGSDFEGVEVKKDQWLPSIFMPRWASRLTLEITDVRVERLNDISEEDAKAEGCAIACCYVGQCNSARCATSHYRGGYRLLWESINGPGSWEQNPWVWCVSFRKLEATK